MSASAVELRVAAKTQTSRLQIRFSDFERISNKKIGLSELAAKVKRLQRNPYKTLYVESGAKHKRTQRNPPAADAAFHVILWTVPNSQEGTETEG